MKKEYEKMRLLNGLIGETNAVYHEIAKCSGVSDSTMQVLYTAYSQGGSCSVREICLWCGISKQTLNSALRKMETEGLLELREIDGRKKRVCLTEAGMALAKQTAGLELDMEAAILENWGPETTELYLSLTKRYLDDLRRGLEGLRQKRKDTYEE